MEIGTIISLTAYFVLMLGIGYYAYHQSTSNISGYMLGGRNLSPAVTALSAGASDMSGWMLMGLPGAMFVAGLSSVWIGIGLVIGAFLNYLIVAPRLRLYTELAKDSITIPDYLENRFEDNSHILRLISSIVIILFFTLYTSSGIVAGGKLFKASFGLDYYTGLYITAGVVVAYTMFGGFLAVSLTDFVQGCIMLVALVLVPIVTLTELGGLAETQNQLQQVNPALLNMLEGTSLLAIISSMAWGLGYFGQPHIIVRFMAIRSVSDIKTARRIGMSWMTVSLIGAIGTGLFGAAYASAHNLSVSDPETIFILLSELLFHPLISGFLLAAILAAIMSTISSQLLVTSSSLTEDFYRLFANRNAGEKELVRVGRLSVLLVACVAIYLAYDRDSSILSLVSNAWAGFGAAFGPIIIFSLFWKKMNLTAAISGMLAGTATVLFWIYAPVTIDGQALGQVIYEIVPGFLVNSSVIVIVSRFTNGPKTSVIQGFEQMENKLNEMG